MATPFKGQNFSKLYKSQLALGAPFVDPLFPATNTSLFLNGNKNIKNVVWKRPGEICSDPKLCEGGYSPQDVYQGKLGNCWFVAACSVLAGVKVLWNKVIPDYKDQEWNPKYPENYVGMFHFRFWRFGEWIDVVVDDLLPTTNGRLVYTHSPSKNEFWSALLEKAYAKVNGCYEALDGGSLSDALLDFTGGISETIDVKSGKYFSDEAKTKELFKSLIKQKDNHALMCCAIGTSSKGEIETRTSVGLVKGHAYGITAVRMVNLKDTRLVAFLRGREKINMIRLRNPWGSGIEWKGAFSDGSPEWGRISSSEREKIGLTFDDDGEFWMPFDDFVKYFTEISICHLLNTSFFTFSRRWFSASPIFGHWTKGPAGSDMDRSGGCINHINTFLRNPQYCLDVESEDEEIICQLLQPDTRERRREGAKNLEIGLYLIKVEANRNCRVHNLLDVAGRSDYINARSVILRQTIGPGRYVLLPTTFAPGCTGDYLLRVFSTCSIHLRELVLHAPKPSIWCCVKYPTVVTTVTVRKVAEIQKDSLRALDLYCVVVCEGKSVRSAVASNTQHEAVWDASAIFYRKDIKRKILIEVWSRSLVKDTLMGETLVDAPVTPSRMSLRVDMKGRKNNQSIIGRLTVEYHSKDNLTEL